MLLHAVFLISPIMYLLGFRALVIIPTTLLLLCIIMAVGKRDVPVWVLLLTSASLATACGAGVYWESWRVALFPAFFGVSLLTVSISTSQERQRVVGVASVLLIVVLAGAWISFLGALNGLSPIGEFTSATGRMLTAYPTTLTPVIIGGFIRPAGIYDEPGALSLVVCVFAFLRHVMHMDKKTTWAMLLLGFVTFSLAHLVYVTIHFLSERRVLRAWTGLVVIGSVAFIALSAIGVWDYFDTRLLARVSVTAESDRLIRGDNRSTKMLNAFEAVKEGGGTVFMYGIDVACMEGSTDCENNHPLMGQNPISPLAHQGILVSWPYYLFVLVSLVIGGLRRSWWALLAVGLLFMQRPSVLSAGYSMLAALVLISLVREPFFRKFTAHQVGVRYPLTMSSLRLLLRKSGDKTRNWLVETR